MSQPHARPGEAGAPVDDPVEPFFRILLLLRWVTLLLTVTLDMARLPQATQPVLVATACVLMTVVTAVVSGVVTRRPALRASAAWGEVAVALVLALCTLVALPAGLRVPPLTGFWITAGPLAVLLSCGWGQGIGACVLLGAAALAVEPLTLDRVGLVLALVAGGAAFGWTLDIVRRSVRERERMRGLNAALAERQRLARIVHDGVLQVLAMVEREGAHLGPRGAMLARHAHEQEAQLRALIQQTDLRPDSRDERDVTHRDFSAMLDRHAAQSVSVATPVEPLLMESRRAAELDAAVTEVLNNTAKHAGPGARAWIFLEIDGDTAIVSIRDDGVGGHPEQFAQAMRSGRMGMKHSIHGRIAELGGTATLRTAPGRGVEWELRVPIEL